MLCWEVAQVAQGGHEGGCEQDQGDATDRGDEVEGAAGDGVAEEGCSGECCGCTEGAEAEVKPAGGGGCDVVRVEAGDGAGGAERSEGEGAPPGDEQGWAKW